MSNYVSDEIVRAPKKGFSSPDASWFKGESIDFVRNTLMSQKSPIYDYIDFGISTRLVDEHLSGKENKRLYIWSLLNLNTWIQQSL